jgi:hypothetical protein
MVRMYVANRRSKFEKRGRLFIRVHNETLSVASICGKMSCPHGRIRCLNEILRSDDCAGPDGAARHAKSSVLIHSFVIV